MDHNRMVGPQIRRLNNLLRRRADEALADIDQVTGMQGRVLGYLAHNQQRDIFQRDLEEEFRIRRSTATGILQLMEKKGLVERRPVAWDARLKRLCLTEKALAIHQVIDSQLRQMEEQLASCLTPEELDQFFLIMGKLRRHLEE